MLDLAVIYVVGLGPGDMSSLPLGTMQQLQSGRPLYFRTFIHPVVSQLLADGLQAESFDSLYESGENFEQIYAEMAVRLLAIAKEKGDIVYAVPGHPLMAEQSVQNLLKLAEDTAIQVEIVSGQSFVDAVCTLLRVDPIEGLAILDGTMLDSKQIRPSLHTLVVQVFHPSVASDVKLTLMEVFPDDYEVRVVRAAGVPGEEKQASVPLYDLDRVSWIDHLTTVYVPPSAEEKVLRKDPWQVVNLVRRLREPGGCPWDQKQTHLTLRPYVIEEAYEVAEAIDNEDDFALAEELGDLLLQVLLHAQIGSEQGMFDIRDVFAALADKLIRRHPHVFGEAKANSAEEAEQFWSTAKAGETSSAGVRSGEATSADVPSGETKSADIRSGETTSADVRSGQTKVNPSILAKVKWAQPAIHTSISLQKAAAKVGFDWPAVEGVLAKVREETEEVAEGIGLGDQTHLTEEVGDLMFTIVNLARWLEVDLDYALSLANRKFSRRLVSIEEILQKSGQNFDQMSLEQLDFYWNQSKAQEKTLDHREN